MNAHTDSIWLTAKVLGLALILGMAVVMFGNLYLAADLYVANDAVQTAANILAHETRFRVQLLCNLFYVADILVVLVAQYLILRPIGQGVALTALLFRFVFALSWCMSALYMLDALVLLGDSPYLHVIESNQLQALARVDLHGTYSAYYVGLPFWALAAVLSSWQWLKSGYIPKTLAWFGILSSAWCVFCGRRLPGVPPLRRHRECLVLRHFHGALRAGPGRVAPDGGTAHAKAGSRLTRGRRYGLSA